MNKFSKLTQKQTKKMRLGYLAGVLCILDKELENDPNVTVPQLWNKFYSILLENEFDFADLPQKLTYLEREYFNSKEIERWQ